MKLHNPEVIFFVTTKRACEFVGMLREVRLKKQTASSVPDRVLLRLNIFLFPYRAEHHPNGWGVAKYDPVNNSIGIYISTMNIFIRIATILGMGGNRRK